MARGFGVTFGAGASDIVNTAYNTISSAKRTYSVWFNAASTGAAGFGRFWNAETGGGTPQDVFQYASPTIGFFRGFSGSTASWNVGVNPSNNRWHHAMVAYDAGSTANVPVIYFDGVAQSVATGTAPIGTPVVTNAIYSIGNRATGIRNFDGMLCEFAIWDGILLTANEARALARGVPPLLLRPSSLSLYIPMYGLQASDPDWSTGHKLQTITGTVKRNHAPISNPFAISGVGVTPTFTPPPPAPGAIGIFSAPYDTSILRVDNGIFDVPRGSIMPQ